MKWAFLLLPLLCGTALARHAQVDCSATNIGQTYTASSPGLPISGLSPAVNNHLAVWNPSTSRICVDVGQYSGTAPDAGGADEHCIPANSYFAWDFVTINASVFIRADGSDCTTATVDIDVW